jgi:hypothetical protein
LRAALLHDRHGKNLGPTKPHFDTELASWLTCVTNQQHRTAQRGRRTDMNWWSRWGFRIVAGLLAAIGFSTIASILIEVLKQNKDKQPD